MSANNSAVPSGASVGAATAKGAAGGALAGAAFGPWGAAIGGVVGGGISFFKAKSQQKKARAINAARPKYVIPSEVGTNVNMYNTMANTTRLPGQSIMEDDIKSNSAAMFNQAQNAAGRSGGSAMLASLGRINKNQNEEINKLNIAGAENQQANKDKLATANMTMADYKQQEFDYNQNQPYELALMRKRALEGASEANMDTAQQNMTNAMQIGAENIGKGKGGGKGGKKASVSSGTSYSPAGNSGSFGSGNRRVYTGSMGVK